MSLEEFTFLICVFRIPRNQSSPFERVNSLLEVDGRGKKFIQLNLIYISFFAYTCDREYKQVYQLTMEIHRALSSLGVRFRVH